MILYYIRHGEPIYDPDCLTELGHKQADAVSKRLALYGVDEIYSSTSIRARQTAEPTAKLLGKEIKFLDWAHESKAAHYFGATVEGKWGWSFFFQEYLRKYNDPEVLTMGRKWYEHPHFQGEIFGDGCKMIEEETDKFMLSLGYRHDRENRRYGVVEKNEKRIAFFAHHGFGMAFLSALLDIPFPIVCTTFDISHTGVSVVHFDEEEKEWVYPKLLQLSNDSHLYKEDLMMGYHGRIQI
jgi:probable phosphoglycerate mutase